MAKKSITSEKVRFKNVRIAFVNLDKPTKFDPKKSDEEEAPKYRLQVLLDPTNAEHAQQIEFMLSEGKRIATEFWDGAVPKSLEKCFGKGDDLDKVYAGYAGMVYCKLANRSLPPIVGTKKVNGAFVQLQPNDKEFPYAGCYANVTATLWTQDSHGRKAINGNLLAIQFVREGERFAGANVANADEEFEALGDKPGTPTGATTEKSGADPFDL